MIAKRLIPIPFELSLDLIFLPDATSDEERRENIRGAVRKHFRKRGGRRGDDAVPFWREYNEEVSEIIREVLAES